MFFSFSFSCSSPLSFSLLLPPTQLQRVNSLLCHIHGPLCMTSGKFPKHQDHELRPLKFWVNIFPPSVRLFQAYFHMTESQLTQLPAVLACFSLFLLNLLVCHIYLFSITNQIIPKYLACGIFAVSSQVVFILPFIVQNTEY